MRRRNFIAGLGVVAALPVAARAQRQLPVIGMLNSGTVEPRRDQIEWFQRGLKEAGFAEGENVIIVKRGADDHYDRLPALAAELVRQQVAVIATVGGPVAALAAKTATATIPIVFAAVSDPVKSGLVASLATSASRLPPTCRFISVIRAVHGSAAATRTPTACCDSTSREEPISRASPRPTSTQLRCGSINARERPWASKPLPIDCDWCCTDRLNAPG